MPQLVEHSVRKTCYSRLLQLLRTPFPGL